MFEHAVLFNLMVPVPWVIDIDPGNVPLLAMLIVNGVALCAIPLEIGVVVTIKSDIFSNFK